MEDHPSRRDVLVSGKIAIVAPLAAASAPASVPPRLWPTPQQFGARGDGATDDYEAFAAAIEYCSSLRLPALTASGAESKIYSTLPTLHVPLAHYRLSRTIEIKSGTMNIQAEPGAILLFPPDTHGIIVQRFDTAGETTSAQSTGGDATTLCNLGLRGSGGTGLKHGIWMRARARILNCSVRQFSGDGVHIVADVAADGRFRGNANGWIINGLFTERNGRNGLFVDGGDVNAGTAINVDAQYNGRWGVHDSSFLGNTHIGHHADSNGLLGAGPQNNQSTIPTIVTHQGIRYAVVIGAEDAASEIEPGRNSNVWVLVSGGGSTSEIPAWTRGRRYASGGSYASDDPNARCTWLGCYEEGGQAQHQISRPSIVLGGLMQGTARSNGASLVGNRLSTPQLKVGGVEIAGSIRAITDLIGLEVTAGQQWLFENPASEGWIGAVCTASGKAGSTATIKKYGQLEP